MAFRPETAKPLNELVEILLHSPNTLDPRRTRADRDLRLVSRTIATTARQSTEPSPPPVSTTTKTWSSASKRTSSTPTSPKAEGPAGDRRQGAEGRQARHRQDVAERARLGATDIEIHDTVLIAAAFCMYNRYVDGLAPSQPEDEAMYRERGKSVAREGYVTVSKEYLPAERSTSGIQRQNKEQ